MTDNKIIKDLEEMAEYPHYYEEGQILKNVLDLIARQQAEIEKLESANDEKFNQWNMLAEKTKQHYADLYNEAKDILKAEAVKEFVERLKNKSLTKWDYHDAVDIDEIDNLVKEMVGE